MIARELEPKIKTLATKFPVVTVTGPRQSGKTTLVKSAFPDKKYVTLEDLDTRTFALDDPRAFFANLPHGAILDEVQRAPQLFSYLQGVVDQRQKPGEFILTGSHNFLLMESISQSLAGRAAISRLLPFSNSELAITQFAEQSLENRLFTGGYPPIYDRDIPPADFFVSYLQTYIERDIRLLKNIHDLSLFARFMKLCAARTGQLLNISSLAADCGISFSAAQSWLSLLQTSYIIYLLQPHHVNFTKRLTRMPKLYFLDSGLACFLLNIETPEQLSTHYLRGGLFENMIITELLKHFANRGKEAPLFFWRDKTGNEIDCLIETDNGFHLVEIKSAQTYHDDFMKNIRYYQKLNAGKYRLKATLVYAGSVSQQRTGFELKAWNESINP